MSLAHRERVLRAATSSFLARGYASSVDDIARRARVADGIATFRTLVPEVPRFRALARAMYANTAGEMVRCLADFLARAHAEGKLRVPDAEFSAEMLLSMLTGHDRLKRLF